MSDDALLQTALQQIETLIRDAERQPDAATPCSDWSAAQLSEHVVATTQRFADGARGEEVDWSTPPPAVEGDLAEALAAAGADLLDARVEAGEEAGPPDWMLGEYAVHSWDLAMALGRGTEELDPQVAEQGRAFMAANLTPDKRGAAFAPEQPAPDGADAYTRIAAFAGRRTG
ncbi:DinB family protein [Nocardioides sambongensis]|uniref:maleylpyruvate isomerase N-terminal domain-containing protein n=1 Tax=Nocardioides sambongensis TaxID=2589074 RepID=UPI0011274593|nr:maleylpyruvate isomerase N-terminal domain-containing protein [Nocardioides sambongensis]